MSDTVTDVGRSAGAERALARPACRLGPPPPEPVAADVYRRVVKPVVDRVVAAVLLVVLAMPLLLVALVVLLSLGRPILFVQDRVGRGGRTFRVLKFRTMRPSRRRRQLSVAHDRRRSHKVPDDPRLTATGRFLRRWSIDELPQLLNVVKGEMSIVGPRPELPEIVAAYPPELHARHAVRPGLTGLWQVCARGDGLMHENGHWDLEYVQRIGLRTDLSILLRTPAAIVGSRRGH